MCVCMCKSTHVWACTCGARGWRQVSSSIALHLLYWGRVSPLNPELTDSSLVRQLAPGILSLPPCPHKLSLLIGCHRHLNSELQSSHVHGKHFTWWASSPGPLSSYCNSSACASHSLLPQVFMFQLKEPVLWETLSKVEVHMAGAWPSCAKPNRGSPQASDLCPMLMAVGPTSQIP